MKIQILAFLAFLSVSNFSMAMTGPEAKTTKEVMNKALGSFVNLQPFIHDPNKFYDKKHDEYINVQLQNIIDVFKSGSHNAKLNAPGFKPSFETISSYLVATKEAFNSPHKGFAHNRLQALSGLCMSCHTQLDSQNSSRFSVSLKAVRRDSFQSDFEYAEFLFLLRDFTSSARYYERVLSEVKAIDLKKKMATPINFETYKKALQRLVTINIKISYKPEQALAYIDKYASDRLLPPLVRDDFTSWKAQIKDLQKIYTPWNVSNAEELLRFEKKYLNGLDEEGLGSGAEDMKLLAMSGVLTKFLNFRPNSKEAPHALYWLGIAEERLHFNFFYSLGELYLKECVERYPKHPYAKKCFKKYEEIIVSGFSGSAGTDIPSDEQKELSRLKSLISQ